MADHRSVISTARGPGASDDVHRAQSTALVTGWMWRYLGLRLALKLGWCTFHEAASYAASVQFAAGKHLRRRFYRHYLSGCGEDLEMHPFSIISMDGTRLGNRILINSFVNIGLADIGDDCLIGPGVSILAGARQHGFATRMSPMNCQPGEKRLMIIGRDVWLGANAVVANHVGEGAIVAAGAVVIEEVSPYHIVAGVPARTIGVRPE